VCVIGTARTADKLERAKPLGMFAGVVPEGNKFADAVRKHGEPSVVLELIGGPYVDEDIRTVPVLGGSARGPARRCARRARPRRHPAQAAADLRHRAARAPAREKIAAMRSFEAHVVPLLQRGLITPVIDTVMDLDAAAAAHERMASNVGFGKIILRT